MEALQMIFYEDDRDHNLEQLNVELVQFDGAGNPQMGLCGINPKGPSSPDPAPCGVMLMLNSSAIFIISTISSVLSGKQTMSGSTSFWKDPSSLCRKSSDSLWLNFSLPNLSTNVSINSYKTSPY